MNLEKPSVNSGTPLVALLVACLFMAVSLPQASAQDAPRPNIIVILCDDLGYADMGFNGAKGIKTPELDKLASGGTVFSSAYVVHPFCGPSRMGLLAGRYPHAFGAPYNLPNPGQGIEEYENEGIPVSETLMSAVLQGAGYRTGAIGKWHLGHTAPFHPNRRGFDDFYGFLGGGHMYFPERFGPIYERQKKAGKGPFNEYIVPLEHNGQEVQEMEYLTDGLSREAVRFVTESATIGKPFFLYLAYNAPHTPLEAKKEDLAKFSAIKDEKRRTYAAMVYAVDRGVGKLVDALKSTGAFENSLIVFLSDNGGKLGAGADNGPLSGGKGSITEGGYRVPMFFHWPKQIAADRRFEHPVSALDFYPTFAQLAGATLPDGKILDGRDILSAVKAGESARPGGMIFALRHFNGFSNVGTRQDEWKVIKQGPNSPWNLYNLSEDIGETMDLSARYPERVRTMVGEAAKWSETHIQPRWFDSRKPAQNWKETSMPNYDKTFAIK